MRKKPSSKATIRSQRKKRPSSKKPFVLVYNRWFANASADELENTMQDVETIINEVKKNEKRDRKLLALDTTAVLDNYLLILEEQIARRRKKEK